MDYSFFVICPHNNKLCGHMSCANCENHKHSKWTQGKLFIECKRPDGVYQTQKAFHKNELR